jgi:hypothetical protein
MAAASTKLVRLWASAGAEKVRAEIAKAAKVIRKRGNDMVVAPCFEGGVCQCGADASAEFPVAVGEVESSSQTRAACLAT